MIRAVVVDDERPSLQKLEKMLSDSGLAEVAGVFAEPLEALAFLKENKADAVFLDIEMPDMDGIELASRILDLQGNTAVVFVTAYNQYAIEAFRLNAIDYLVKPVPAARLRESLCRIAGEKRIPENNGGLTVRCFGKFTAAAGTEEVKFRTEKAEELLAFLIDHGGGFVSRGRIIDSLWEDFDGDRALIHFNTTLHNVKKALLSYGLRISILYDRGSYRLDAGKIDCDYFKFRTLTEKAAAAENSIDEWEEAAALYRGEYLAGWECGWAAGKRLLLEERYIGLLLEIAGRYGNTGDHRKAVRWLTAGLLHEPLHRELNYRLVEVLLSVHERVLAAKYFDLYRSGLAKKTGLEPDDGFKRLFG